MDERDVLGRFKSGRIEPQDVKEKRCSGWKRSWRKRDDYHGLVVSPLHNVWRSFRFTIKGKKAGYSSEWKDFVAFYVDMESSYFDGARLIRVDKSKPFCKENCRWGT